MQTLIKYIKLLMFHNEEQDKPNIRAYNTKLKSLSKSEPKSEQPIFRMTQRITKPLNSKKIKSEAVSPEESRPHRSNIPDIKNIRKSLNLRTEINCNKNSIYNAQMLLQQKTGRSAALSNHSPSKIKIKTSRLLIDMLSTNPNTEPRADKSEGKSKNTIQSSRRYTIKKQRVPTEKEVQTGRVDADQENGNHRLQFTLFQAEEIRKYAMYYPGTRRIANRSQFTDEEGYPIVQKGDSIAYRYQILSEMGKGAFGYVFKAMDHKRKQKIALKIIRSQAKLHKQTKVQIQILQKCIQQDQQCKNNIVRIKGSFVFRSHTCIAYQMLAINLYQYLKLNKFRCTPENILVKFSIQMMHALAFLRAHKIVHCDIKPENIMLRDQQKTGIRLIDFGSSCFEDQQYYTYIQSRYYRAPEIILGIRYTTAIDVWSFGCVLAEMYTGVPLFPGESQEEQLLMFIELLGNPPNHMIEAGSRRKRFFNENFESRIIQSQENYRVPKGLSFQKALDNCTNKLFIDFIKKCIEWDPVKRIDPKEALLHEWIIEGLPVNIRTRHIVEVTGEPLNF